MPGTTTTDSTTTTETPVTGREVASETGNDQELNEAVDARDAILQEIDPGDDDDYDADADAEDTDDEGDGGDEPTIDDETMQILSRAGLDKDDVEAMGLERATKLAEHQKKIQADTDAAFAKLKGDVGDTNDTGDDGEKQDEADPGAFELDLSKVIEEASLDLGEEDAAAFGAMIQAGVSQAYAKLHEQHAKQAEITAGTHGLVDAILASTIRAELSEAFPDISDPTRFAAIRDRAELLSKDSEFVEKISKRPEVAKAMALDGPLAVYKALYDEAASIEFAKDSIKRKADERRDGRRARSGGQPTRPGVKPSRTSTSLSDMNKDQQRDWVLKELEGGRAKSEVEAELRAANAGRRQH